MKTTYQVMVLVDHRYQPYTGRIWDQDHVLDAHEELWDAQHDGEVEDAYIMEVTA